MSDTGRFEFCPKCGALTRDGQCQSCGYRASSREETPEEIRGQYSGALPGQGENPGAESVQEQTAGQMQEQAAGQMQEQAAGQTQEQTAWQAQNQAAWQGAYQYPYQDPGPNPYQSSYQNMYPNLYQGMYPLSPAGAAPQKKNGGMVAGVAAVAALLVIAVFVVSFAAFYSLGRGDAKDPRDYSWFVGDDKVDRDKDREKDRDAGQDREDPSEETHSPEQTVPEPGLSEGEYYGELYSAMRDDLQYRINMETGYFAPREYENVEVSIDYPQIAGDVDNLEYLNEILEYEYQYYLDYFADEYEPDMDPDSYYICRAECYITYMDEDVMSVVFREELALDWFSAISFYCLNFNMKDGVLMNNTEMLNMDQSFAIDFRNREVMENGDNWLTDYSDQEILQMLRDPDYLVIFYTPIGMVVGLNMQEVVIYVTYSDYEKYLGSY